MDNPGPNILSLCTGGGGLDIGLELAIPNARVVCGVEWEAFACEYLAAAMRSGCMAPFPVWSDLRTFDGRPWRGVVDCVTAGYPCQPFSYAGRQLGNNDPRHLWPHVKRVIGECEPKLIFLENVAGHLRLGLREVLGDLHSLGYRTAAGLFTAAEVGAIHKRERLFVLCSNSTVIRHEGPRDHRCNSNDQQENESWKTTDALDALARNSVPVVCSNHDGVAATNRKEWLKLLGNGVVPLQAAYAFTTLLSSIQKDT